MRCRYTTACTPLHPRPSLSVPLLGTASLSSQGIPQLVQVLPMMLEQAADESQAFVKMSQGGGGFVQDVELGENLILIG